jgi:hypothetical protein
MGTLGCRDVKALLSPVSSIARSFLGSAAAQPHQARGQDAADLAEVRRGGEFIGERDVFVVIMVRRSTAIRCERNRKCLWRELQGRRKHQSENPALVGPSRQCRIAELASVLTLNEIKRSNSAVLR